MNTLTFGDVTITRGSRSGGRSAGVTPEQVDTVVCTHLHVDHVGWNTCRDGRRWVPTFPQARYVIHGEEWQF